MTPVASADSAVTRWRAATVSPRRITRAAERLSTRRTTHTQMSAATTMMPTQMSTSAHRGSHEISPNMVAALP